MERVGVGGRLAAALLRQLREAPGDVVARGARRQDPARRYLAAPSALHSDCRQFPAMVEIPPGAREQLQEGWNEARKSVLFRQIVSGKLRLREASDQYGLDMGLLREWLRQFRRSALLAFDDQLKRRLVAQGAPADALDGAEFTGTLADLSVADLVQLLQLTGKSAVITVTHDGADGRLWCSSGAIVDAECGRSSGEAAAYRMLALESGRVCADLRSAPRARTIHLATHQLLLEAARRKDESDRLRAELGGEQQCYVVADRAWAELPGLDAAERDLLRRFEDARSLREVVAQSDLDELEALTLLRRLVRAGLLVRAGTRKRSPHGRATKDAERNLFRELVSGTLSWPPRASARPHWALDAVSQLLLIPAAFWLGSKVPTVRPRAAAPLPAPGQRSAG